MSPSSVLSFTSSLCCVLQSGKIVRDSIFAASSSHLQDSASLACAWSSPVAPDLHAQLLACAGTGKTHAVRGILNVWHIVHYNRFLGSLVNALAK